MTREAVEEVRELGPTVITVHTTGKVVVEHLGGRVDLESDETQTFVVEPDKPVTISVEK